ncbi:AraC family transcriptional regulator [Actinoplanes sp. NPDC024001]|uniref:AraC family transcriptional regulator n=1 Tax=Actinoplanes sp. NPDC024001 TaxID=3154598 RepID=UPI0033C32BB7
MSDRPQSRAGGDDNRVRRLSLRSADVDQVRSFGGRHFYPRKFLHPLGRSGRLDARFDLLQVGALTIGDVRYGADVTLGYENPDAYQVGVPLAGRLETHQGGRAIIGAGTQAGLFRVGEDVVIDRWAADCRQLGVKIGRELLEGRLQTLLDAPGTVPLKLSAQLDISTGMGHSWAALVRLIAAEFSNETGLLREPLIVHQLQETLIMGLLMACDHPYRAELARQGRAYRPAPVRRAIDAIQADPQHPFTVAELARAAGVSVRTLQTAFRSHLGCSPMAYLRQVRLDRAHQELRASDPRHTTVTQIAYRWGFVHLSRFADAYRARYGTTPRETLREP